MSFSEEKSGNSDSTAEDSEKMFKMEEQFSDFTINDTTSAFDPDQCESSKPGGMTNYIELDFTPSPLQSKETQLKIASLWRALEEAGVKPYIPGEKPTAKTETCDWKKMRNRKLLQKFKSDRSAACRSCKGIKQQRSSEWEKVSSIWKEIADTGMEKKARSATQNNFTLSNHSDLEQEFVDENQQHRRTQQHELSRNFPRANLQCLGEWDPPCWNDAADKDSDKEEAAIPQSDCNLGDHFDLQQMFADETQHRRSQQRERSLLANQPCSSSCTKVSTSWKELVGRGIDKEAPAVPQSARNLGDHFDQEPELADDTQRSARSQQRARFSRLKLQCSSDWESAVGKDLAGRGVNKEARSTTQSDHLDLRQVFATETRRHERSSRPKPPSSSLWKNE